MNLIFDELYQAQKKSIEVNDKFQKSEDLLEKHSLMVDYINSLITLQRLFNDASGSVLKIDVPTYLPTDVRELLKSEKEEASNAYKNLSNGYYYEQDALRNSASDPEGNLEFKRLTALYDKSINKAFALLQEAEEKIIYK
jgi:hypothetical protein